MKSVGSNRELLQKIKELDTAAVLQLLDQSLFTRVVLSIALFEATRNNLEDLVVPLLEKGAHPNELISTKHQSGWTPFLLAAKLGHARIVLHMLANGADLNARLGETTVESLAATPAVKKIIEDWKNNSDGEPSPFFPLLFHTIKSGKTQDAIYFLQNGHFPPQEKIQLLSLATETDNIKIVQKLLEQDTNVNGNILCNDFPGWTPFLSACSRGNPTIITLMTNYGGNPDTQHPHTLKTAREYALSYNINLDQLKRKLENQNENDIENDIENEIEIIKNQYGTKFDYVIPSSHKTLLMEAAQEGNVIRVIALIRMGANVNKATAPSDFRYTALMFAAKGGHFAIVKLLVENGALLNMKSCTRESQDDSTALIYATARGHVDIVEYLIQRGAEKHHTSFGGKTALFIAGKCSRVQTKMRMLQILGATHPLSTPVRMPVRVSLPAPIPPHAPILVPVPTHAPMPVSSLPEQPLKHKSPFVENYIKNKHWKDLILALQTHFRLEWLEPFLSDQETVLALATEYKKNKCYFLEREDEACSTPLAKASFRGNLDLVKALLTIGAKLDGISKKRTQAQTALIVAATYGEVNIVRYLLEAGANRHITDKKGNTAYKSASLIYAHSPQDKYQEIMTLLTEEPASKKRPTTPTVLLSVPPKKLRIDDFLPPTGA